MNVIFITDSYYPNPSPNAICVEKLRTEFNKRNIKTDIVALRTFPKQKCKLQDKSVHFVSPDILYGSLYNFSKTPKTLVIKSISILFRIRSLFNGFMWPLLSLSHLFKYTKQVGKLLESSSDETIVIGVYKSLEAAAAGAFAKKIWGKGTFFLYTLDAVSGSIIPSIYGSKVVSKISIKRWEKFLFTNYDYLYLMNSHKSYYSNKEYDNYRCSIRYVDIPLFFSHQNIRHIYTDKKHLVFTGSLSKNTAYPIYLFELLEYIKDDNICVDFYGTTEDKTILNLIEHSRYAIFHGKVSHDEIVKIQDNADFLLNFGNATPCAIPCKIFEYFSTSNPVISFLKIDDDASEPYVQRYPNSLMIDERKAIQENAELFVQFINSEHIADKEKIKKAFIDNAPETTVNKILKDFESCQKH